jgi:hydroxymethylbilane synthase
MAATRTAELRIATRASRLARVQAEIVADALRRRSGVSHSIVEISTKGDAARDRSIAAIGGDGVFVKELEAALLEGRADVAVHSLKDLPTQRTPGVDAGVTLERADARDVLVSRDNRFASVADLPAGAVVGTSSLRRRAQLANVRPDLDIRDIRGNVDTRVRKVLDGEFDAALLAFAGMQRIGLLDLVGGGSPLALDLFVPAAGQFRPTAHERRTLRRSDITARSRADSRRDIARARVLARRRRRLPRACRRACGAR